MVVGIMKIQIEASLEEVTELLNRVEDTRNSHAAKYVLHDFDQMMRNKLKHENLTTDQYSVWEEARNALHTTTRDYNMHLTE